MKLDDETIQEIFQMTQEAVGMENLRDLIPGKMEVLGRLIADDIEQWGVDGLTMGRLAELHALTLELWSTVTFLTGNEQPTPDEQIH